MHPKYFNVIVYNFISCMNVSVSMQILLIHTNLYIFILGIIKFIHLYKYTYIVFLFIPKHFTFVIKIAV